MAVISRSYLDALTRSLNTLSEATQVVARSELAALEYTDIADLRRKVLAIIEPLLSTATDMAAGLAAQNYDSIRETAIGSTSNAVAQSGHVPGATERAIRALVSEVDKSGYEAFVRSIEARCDYEIKRAAGKSTLYNAERDPEKPRFARVPTGTETCEFCLMLASRGFVYRSMASAGALDHYHPHCDCRIVPGFDGMEIEGYDPDELYTEWKERQRNPGHARTDRTTTDPPSAPIKQAVPLKKNQGINWDADVYRKLDPNDVDRISTIINNAPDSPVKRMYLKWEDKLRLGSPVESNAHFSPDSVMVNLDVKKTLSDTRKTPGSAWFHEHGHQIDYLITGSEPYAEKIKKLGSWNSDKAWASTSYQNGLFRRTIVSEVSDHVDGRLKSLRERRKELIKNQDLDGLFREKFIDNGQLFSLNKIKGSFSDDAKGFDRVLKDTVKQVPKAKAYQSIEEELKQLDAAQRADLSDIFEGATNCAVRAGFGHGKKYWETYENLPIEAFAEFFSAELMNPASLKQLEKWLPESKAVFDDIISEMEKGTL